MECFQFSTIQNFRCYKLKNWQLPPLIGLMTEFLYPCQKKEDFLAISFFSLSRNDDTASISSVFFVGAIQLGRGAGLLQWLVSPYLRQK